METGKQGSNGPTMTHDENERWNGECASISVHTAVLPYYTQSKQFLGRGTAPDHTPAGEEDTPPQILPPSAPTAPRLWPVTLLEKLWAITDYAHIWLSWL